METPNNNVYRLRSMPDLVFRLGELSTDVLMNIDGHLHAQGERVQADIVYIEEYLARRNGNEQLTLPEPPDIVA
jgi:hypothetical protein